MIKYTFSSFYKDIERRSGATCQNLRVKTVTLASWTRGIDLEGASLILRGHSCCSQEHADGRFWLMVGKNPYLRVWVERE